MPVNVNSKEHILVKDYHQHLNDALSIIKSNAQKIAEKVVTLSLSDKELNQIDFWAKEILNFSRVYRDLNKSVRIIINDPE